MAPQQVHKSESVTSRMAIETKATPITDANSKYKKPKPRIPATDPKHIQNLWCQVRKQKRGNMAPKQQPNYMMNTSASAKKKNGKITSDNSSSTAPSVVSTALTSKSQSITIKNPEFRDLCLKPRGIYIDPNSYSVGSPQVHFRVTEPPDYTELDGLEDAMIWLHTDDEFIEDVQREYRFMNDYNLCEAEYASFAKETLLKREPRKRLSDDTGTSGARLRRAERMVEFTCKPESMLSWEAPPFIAPSWHGRTHLSYDFNIRPDCTYWLALHAFSSEYVSQVRDITAVPQKRMTCPYLTIEFKRDDTNMNKAVDQVATFGAVALYNRYLLRAKSISDMGQGWTHEQTCQLRHYALTATGSSYVFWCIRPTLLKNREWNGCNMEKIFGDDFETKTGVKNFVRWINEIHRWALTVYIESCEMDVKRILKKNHFRTSDIVITKDCSCESTDIAAIEQVEAANRIEG